MWFFGVPTGLALIVLNRFIPESPRFLLANGRRGEAHAAMRKFGIVMTEKAGPTERLGQEAQPDRRRLFTRPYRGLTLALIVYGLAWGLANFGFVVWLPTYVDARGISAATVIAILAKAALFAIPGSILVSWLYGQ